MGPSGGCFSPAVLTPSSGHGVPSVTVPPAPWCSLSVVSPVLTPWGPLAVGLGLHGQPPSCGPSHRLPPIPAFLCFVWPVLCFPECRLPFSWFTFRLLFSLCAGDGPRQTTWPWLLHGLPVPRRRLPLRVQSQTDPQGGLTYVLVAAPCCDCQPGVGAGSLPGLLLCTPAPRPSADPRLRAPRLCEPPCSDMGWQRQRCFTPVPWGADGAMSAPGSSWTLAASQSAMTSLCRSQQSQLVLKSSFSFSFFLFPA